jgi:leader peptidase (prepilin peptidase)/N-methyltransferase
MGDAQADRIAQQPSPRYCRMPERFAIACTAAGGVAISMIVAPDLRGLAGSLLALTTLTIAMIDARRFVIPDQLNAIGIALGLFNAGIQEPDAAMEAIGASALRGLTLALVFLGLRVSYRRLRRREGIGLGDVKLAGVAGAWLGWSTIPIGVEIAALTGLLIYVVRRWWAGRPIHSMSRLPFGLFFAPAIWLGWLLEMTELMPF